MSDLLLSLSRWLERNSPPLRDVVWLILRLYVANVFFKSGLTKIDDWSTTLFLFTEEYHVPLLPPVLAAVMGTAGELGLSALLVLGLAGRFSACGLFILNIVAVISYPAVREDAALLASHTHWGLMLAVLAASGPGRLALDAALLRILARRHQNNFPQQG
ncbi:membrane protein [Pokkaliibacter plantistimulans]|uniref:Membrane protein n=1 Tax=Pokkaliibacter plantistimulans TaxID=1635171 RepID=A0ABX5LQE9_9GAMM|nr:DoxX family protein [Pokkaliibacter plantistimulans]PXF28882.1 membrane protein [Pokkaliibacter plantistimulans]